MLWETPGFKNHIDLGNLKSIVKLNPPVKKLKLSHFWFKAYDETETEIDIFHHEHQYTEATISFDTLKGADMGRVTLCLSILSHFEIFPLLPPPFIL